MTLGYGNWGFHKISGTFFAGLESHIGFQGSGIRVSQN